MKDQLIQQHKQELWVEETSCNPLHMEIVDKPKSSDKTFSLWQGEDEQKTFKTYYHL